MDPFDLDRFVAAQRETYATALGELENGRKHSHWMWFVFPQLAELGRSATARFYGIGSAAEARAYLKHPLLGPRLGACTDAVLSHPDKPAEAIFGAVDTLKFRSSMTLFEAVASAPQRFAQALDTFFDGGRDPATLRLIGA